MTTLTHATRRDSFPLPSLLRHLLDAMGFSAEALARRRTYRQTLRELTAMSDRDLADIGISRSLIGQVAREAAGY
jgi:uncharacterized protein YjiS (DUF1127 family)